MVAEKTMAAYLAEQDSSSTAPELVTIEENSLKTIAVTKYEIAAGMYKANDKEVIVYSYEPKRGDFIIINPADDRCMFKMEPHDANGNLIDDGLITVYTRTGLQGFSQRIYMGDVEHKSKRYQFGAVISPGDNLIVCFLSNNKDIDPSKSKLKITFLVKKIEMNIPEVNEEGK